MLNFHRECWNPVKKHSKALVFFAVSKQIPIVYSADRGRAENSQHNHKSGAFDYIQSVRSGALVTLVIEHC